MTDQKYKQILIGTIAIVLFVGFSAVGINSGIQTEIGVCVSTTAAVVVVSPFIRWAWNR